MEKRTEDFLLNEIQLILAEKRTSLSILRTGIAVITLPLSALTILVVTSKYYKIYEILTLFIPLVVLCLGLTIWGIYLIIRASRSIRHYDAMIRKLKLEDSRLKEIVKWVSCSAKSSVRYIKYKIDIIKTKSYGRFNCQFWLPCVILGFFSGGGILFDSGWVFG